MTLESPAYVISADSHSAALFRQAAQSMLIGTGVVSTGDLVISQNGTPNMSVNVAAGQIWMPGTLGSATGFPNNLNAQTTYGLPSALDSQASYYAYQDGTVNLTIAAADPTNPRIDLVCASVQDAQYSGSTNQPVLQVITGTPAPSPSPPSAPASTVVLAQVAVAANATQILNANITDERPFLATLPDRFAPGARMYANSQTVISGTTAQITSLVSDWTYGGATASSNAITVPRAGVYLVSASIQWQSSGGAPPAGWYNAAITRNGSTSRTFGQQYLASASTQPVTGGADVMLCAANDVLKLYGTSSVTAASNYAATDVSPTWLSAVMLFATN